MKADVSRAKGGNACSSAALVGGKAAGYTEVSRKVLG